MKVITKTTIKLSDEEYEALIKAQEIWDSIADELYAENLYDKELDKYFSDLNDGLKNILAVIGEGIER